MYVKTYYYFGEVNLDKYYKNMLFGIAIFVGGMITFLIISKILKRILTRNGKEFIFGRRSLAFLIHWMCAAMAEFTSCLKAKLEIAKREKNICLKSMEGERLCG